MVLHSKLGLLFSYKGLYLNIYLPFYFSSCISREFALITVSLGNLSLSFIPLFGNIIAITKLQSNELLVNTQLFLLNMAKVFADTLQYHSLYSNYSKTQEKAKLQSV